MSRNSEKYEYKKKIEMDKRSKKRERKKEKAERSN